MELLKRIPQDGTLNQTRPLDMLLGHREVFSFDLKSATDRSFTSIENARGSLWWGSRKLRWERVCVLPLPLGAALCLIPILSPYHTRPGQSQLQQARLERELRGAFSSLKGEGSPVTYAISRFFSSLWSPIKEVEIVKRVKGFVLWKGILSWLHELAIQPFDCFLALILLIAHYRRSIEEDFFL